MRICGHKQTPINTKLKIFYRIKPKHDHFTQSLRTSLKRYLTLIKAEMYTLKSQARFSPRVKNADQKTILPNQFKFESL